MSKYTENELLRLAKRVNNTKRTYLLVDPMQGKHMPVSPSAALEMMYALGRKATEKYPETRLVIGFAETATAVGAAVAESISGDCAYIHTTRENIADVAEWAEFLEEHSHAAEQRLAADRLRDYISGTDTVIFVDDELSTGKTLINIINSMREIFPELETKKIVAASIINRVSDENTGLMRQNGIECLSLLKIENTDYTKAVENFSVTEAQPFAVSENIPDITANIRVPDARLGVVCDEYMNELAAVCNKFVNEYKGRISGRVLVLGTEEFMYPALYLGRCIENSGIADEVKCHAPTRSPIGISDGADYPIKSGNKIHSFYDADRVTYIYNMEKYDTAVIFTDAAPANRQAVSDIVGIIREKGCKKVILIEGESMFSTYKKEDVTILLKDVTGLVTPLGTKEREARIQSGIHYSMMLPLEYKPTETYMNTFREAVRLYAQITADAVAGVSEKIVSDKKAPVLVSLARAGTSVGVLIKHYIKYKYGIDVPHYTISIIRGRGIDKNAMQYILDRHSPESIQFVDGWTGKGAIQRELDKAMEDYEGVSSGLAVLSDPAYLAEKSGTYDDFLIASSCLNSTVSGLLSRTYLNSDAIGENDFHGALFYKELMDEDLTYYFIDAVEKCFEKAAPINDSGTGVSGMDEVREICEKYGIEDINLVKPSIGEATRVLLRRVPWKILVHSLDDHEHLGHLYQLAEEKGIQLEVYPLKNYRACGLIKKLADN